MTTKTLTPAERVAAGAAWLDANHPGWVDRIDLDRLDLSSACRCILGQQFGDYNLAPLPEGDFTAAAIAMGFNGDPEPVEDEPYWQDLSDLQVEWETLIEARTAVSA